MRPCKPCKIFCAKIIPMAWQCAHDVELLQDKVNDHSIFNNMEFDIPSSKEFRIFHNDFNCNRIHRYKLSYDR